jgi:hypothetical protein
MKTLQTTTKKKGEHMNTSEIQEKLRNRQKYLK